MKGISIVFEEVRHSASQDDLLAGWLVGLLDHLTSTLSLTENYIYIYIYIDICIHGYILYMCIYVEI